MTREDELAALEELDSLYMKARRIAADMIGYPADEADSLAIQNATPAQAIKSLEDEIARLKGIQS